MNPIQAVDSKNDMVASRRQVLTGLSAAGGAFVFGFQVPFISRAQAAGAVNTFVTSYIAIGTDESVTIEVVTQEMGQGIMTGLAQLVASELMVDWARIKVEHAAPPIAGITGGSTSIRNYFTPMRVAGATVREMLRAAAAAAMGVDVSTCVAANGVVTSGSLNMTYGQLAAAASKLTPPTSPPLIGSSPIGLSMPRLDLPAKVNGSAIFGIDVRVPNMVYAAIKQCPTLGGTLPANFVPPKVSGAIAVVPLGNAVAVVADNTWKALQAAKGLSIAWVNPANASQMDSAVINTTAQSLLASGAPLVAEKAGDPTSAISAATTKIDVTYSLPFLAHGYMEVLNCTVNVTPTSCEVWAPTQAPAWVQQTAAAITKLPASAVTVHTTFMGGGLGRKIEQDYIAQAVSVAKAVGRPVKLMWSREEDFSHDKYRPMALTRVQASLDAAGNVSGWSNRIVTPSILLQRGWIGPTMVDSQAVDGAIGLDYSFAARLVEWVRHTTPLPVGFWRSVGHSLNAFAVESAIDELALAGGVDPLAFRQKLLAGSPRSLQVLNAAASLAGWGTPPPAGRARGIAFSVGFGSIVAQVAEISQPTAGSIKVHRVSCAIDCGTAVNPNEVIAQMEGGIIHGMSAAMWGQVNFKNGVSTVKNFNNYRVVLLPEAPQIDVTIVSSGGPLGGVGEPGVPPIAPAIANALAKLTGVRQRSLPLFPGAAMMDS